MPFLPGGFPEDPPAADPPAEVRAEPEVEVAAEVVAEVAVDLEAIFFFFFWMFYYVLSSTTVLSWMKDCKRGIPIKKCKKKIGICESQKRQENFSLVFKTAKIETCLRLTLD